MGMRGRQQKERACVSCSMAIMLVIERFMAFICRQSKLRNAAEKYAILFLRLIMTVSISRSTTVTLCLSVFLSVCLTLYSKQLNCRLMRLRTEHTLQQQQQQQFKLCGCSGVGVIFS